MLKFGLIAGYIYTKPTQNGLSQETTCAREFFNLNPKGIWGSLCEMAPVRSQVTATAGPMLSARPESRVRAWTGSAGIHMGELWESSVVLTVAGYLS